MAQPACRQGAAQTGLRRSPCVAAQLGKKQATGGFLKATTPGPTVRTSYFLCRACYGGVVRFRKADGYMSTPVGIHDPILPESLRLESMRGMPNGGYQISPLGFRGGDESRGAARPGLLRSAVLRQSDDSVRKPSRSHWSGCSIRSPAASRGVLESRSASTARNFQGISCAMSRCRTGYSCARNSSRSAARC